MSNQDISREETESPSISKGETPCWELMNCPDHIHNECPAFFHKEFSCWEIEGTYCKWGDWGALGSDTSVCMRCTVYLKYGSGQHPQLKLRGKGIKLLIDPS